MSEKQIDAVNKPSNDANHHSGLSANLWHFQAMRPVMDTQKADQSIPASFGKFELMADKTDVASPRQFKFHASVSQPQDTDSPYLHPSMLRPETQLVHPQTKQHQYLNGSANETHSAVNSDQLVGTAQIPQTIINGQFHQSETISTKFAASQYKEGEHFDLLKVPAEKGRHNYYNGLANAHFEHGYLVGTPVHLDGKGNIQHAMKQEVAIPLHEVQARHQH